MNNELGPPLLILYLFAFMAVMAGGSLLLQVVVVLIPVALMIYIDYERKNSKG
jgi:hypothetical protein